jgi:hypothetical protein
VGKAADADRLEHDISTAIQAFRTVTEDTENTENTEVHRGAFAEGERRSMAILWFFGGEPGLGAVFAEAGVRVRE